MTRATIYLAGGIAGMEWNECNLWRENVEQLFPDCKVLNPLRVFCHPQETQDTGTDQYSLPFDRKHPDARINALDRTPRNDRFSRDYQDIFNSTHIFMNFIGAKQRSVGTTIEFGMAFGLNRPVVMAMEPGNPNENEFLRYFAGEAFIHTSLCGAVNHMRRLVGLPLLEFGDEAMVTV